MIKSWKTRALEIVLERLSDERIKKDIKESLEKSHRDFSTSSGSESPNLSLEKRDNVFYILSTSSARSLPLLFDLESGQRAEHEWADEVMLSDPIKNRINELNTTFKPVEFELYRIVSYQGSPYYIKGTIPGDKIKKTNKPLFSSGGPFTCSIQ